MPLLLSMLSWLLLLLMLKLLLAAVVTRQAGGRRLRSVDRRRGVPVDVRTRVNGRTE